jgi:hypothetical protein
MPVNAQVHDVVPLMLHAGPVPDVAVTLKMPLPLVSLAVPDKVVVSAEMVLLLPVKATLGAVLSRVMVRAAVLHTGVFTPSVAPALKVLEPADRATLAKL